MTERDRINEAIRRDREEQAHLRQKPSNRAYEKTVAPPAIISSDWIDALGKISASVDRALDVLSDENIGGAFVKDLIDATRGLETLRRQMESASEICGGEAEPRLTTGK